MATVTDDPKPSRVVLLILSGAAAAALVIGLVVGTTGVLPDETTDDHAQVAGAAAPHHDAESAATGDGHHHNESSITYEQLRGTTKAQLDKLIAEYGDKYPTGADASQDGWFKATRSLYGIGAHYSPADTFTVAADFDLMEPNILLFDGEGPDAKFAGVSYIVAGDAPEGFAGSHDTWHEHEKVCFMGANIVSVIEDDSDLWYSEDECRFAGGRLLSLKNDQMVHVWIGPDYIDNAPIFAHDHPKLYNGYHPKGND